MASIKIFACILFGLLTGCSMLANQKPSPVLVKDSTLQCHSELEQKIAVLAELPKVKLSRDVFIKSAYLVLSNHPGGSLLQPDPMVGIQGSEKIFMLYVVENQCFLGLLNHQKKIKAKQALNTCHCISPVDE